MRLVFAGGSHSADITLQPGELSLGASDDCDVHMQDAGWLAHHANVLWDHRRGLWLKLAEQAGTAHVNARPVHECAMLRLGDIVTLGKVQFSVMLEDEGSIVRQVPAPRAEEMTEPERAAASRAVLRGVVGPYHGRAFSLAASPRIGSSADADIRIDEPDIAARHSQMELQQERIIVRAETAGNTLKLNGVLVENAILHPGDQVSIGSHRFIVEAPGLPPRGGADFAPRYRPITETRPATGSYPLQTSVDPEPASNGRFNAGWLLLAATLIALVLGGILLYAPR